MNPHSIRDLEAFKVEEEPRHYDTKAKPTSSSYAVSDKDLFPNFDRPDPDYLKHLADYANELEPRELNYPYVSYYGRLCFYSLQHTCQELNALSEKVLVKKNPTRENLERLRFLLHEHTTAMKDLVYINQDLTGVSEETGKAAHEHLEKHNLHRKGGWLYGPGNVSSFNDNLEIFVKSCLPKHLTRPELHYTNGIPSVGISRVVRIISSAILGLATLASGASIVVPMVIMSFDPSKTKSLVTVSVAVVIFGFVLAAMAKVRGENVVLATATYAAVLVVFVGTSGTSG